MYKYIIIALFAALILYLGGRNVSDNGNVKRISQQQFLENREKENYILVDVRTPEEYSDGHIEGAINVPLNIIENKIAEVASKDDNVVLYCRSGGRSSSAGQVLAKLGYKNIYNLGGINSWKGEIVK